MQGPKVISHCHQSGTILMANQLQVIILVSLKFIIDSQKTGDGLFHLRNSAGLRVKED